MIQLMWGHHWFIYCICTEHTISHYRNQSWPSLARHICGTRARWVEDNLPCVSHQYGYHPQPICLVRKITTLTNINHKYKDTKGYISYLTHLLILITTQYWTALINLSQSNAAVRSGDYITLHENVFKRKTAIEISICKEYKSRG